MSDIIMPNNWDPYPHQTGLWAYLNEGRLPNGRVAPGKRAVCCDHRRSGKDSCSLNIEATEAMRVTGSYYHFLPTLAQAKRVIWNAVDREERRVLTQAFPKEIVKTTNKQDLLLELINGSMWQLGGSDNYNAFVGTNIMGIVFSEWSLCDPKAWEYFRPILRENGGWAIFIYTMRGKNHGYDLLEMAKENPKWYAVKNTVEMTVRHDGTPIISQDDIQEERDSGMSEEMIQQEFYCSEEVELPGAYFAKDLSKTREEKRICHVPVIPTLPVYTFWDLGQSKGNAMTVWFVQAYGKEKRIVNYIEKEDSDLGWFVLQVREFCKYHKCFLGENFAPHDIEVRDLLNKKTRKKLVEEALDFHFTTVKRVGNKNEAIQAAHAIFPYCFFDSTRCMKGINGLASYRRKEDKHNPGKFIDEPLHDWASNVADGFMTFAQGWNPRLEQAGRQRNVQGKLRSDFEVFK